MNNFTLIIYRKGKEEFIEVESFNINPLGEFINIYKRDKLNRRRLLTINFDAFSRMVIRKKDYRKFITIEGNLWKRLLH